MDITMGDNGDCRALIGQGGRSSPPLASRDYPCLGPSGSHSARIHIAMYIMALIGTKYSSLCRRMLNVCVAQTRAQRRAARPRPHAVEAVSPLIPLEHLVKPPLVVVFGFSNVVLIRWHRLAEEVDRACGHLCHAQVELRNIRL